MSKKEMHLSLNHINGDADLKSTSGDEDNEFGVIDRINIGRTYFQEAGLILNEIKNRFLPEPLSKQKVRNIIFFLVLVETVYTTERCTRVNLEYYLLNK